MKRVLSTVVLDSLATCIAHAQEIAGDWQGTLKAGAHQLRIILHVAKQDMQGTPQGNPRRRTVWHCGSLIMRDVLSSSDRCVDSDRRTSISPSEQNCCVDGCRARAFSEDQRRHVTGPTRVYVW